MTELTDRQQLVAKELKKYSIGEGGHHVSDYSQKHACIMEAICLVLGYDPQDRNKLSGYLNPPCISSVIKNFLIAINDGLGTDRQRAAALKPLAPLILNTAPTYVKVTELKTKTRRETKQEKKNLDYIRAEAQRRNLIKDAGLQSYNDFKEFLFDKNGSFQKKKTVDFITELIDVAKFDNTTVTGV